MDNSVVIVGGGGRGFKGINCNGKNTIAKKSYASKKTKLNQESCVLLCSPVTCAE